MRLMLDGACDLHVHCSPDVRERKTTALELARAARDAGMSALLLKNHEFSTVALAATVSEALGGFPVYGGIVLNEAVGALNIAAVEIALRMGAKEVWMPTHCACHERAFRGKPGTGISILNGSPADATGTSKPLLDTHGSDTDSPERVLPARDHDPSLPLLDHEGVLSRDRKGADLAVFVDPLLDSRGSETPSIVDSRYSTVERTAGVRPEVHEICKLMAAQGAILGTAHLSPTEIRALVAVAREHRVRSVVITHPEITFLNLSIDFQRELAGPDVFFERCFVRPLMALDYDGLAASIRAVGISSTFLATDLGQPDNPHPIEGLAQMRSELSARGFSADELDLMLRINARRLLALEAV